MNARNSKSPTTVPWGTPESISASIDIVPLCKGLFSAREEAFNSTQGRTTDPVMMDFVQQMFVWNLVEGLGKVKKNDIICLLSSIYP